MGRGLVLTVSLLGLTEVKFSDSRQGCGEGMVPSSVSSRTFFTLSGSPQGSFPSSLTGGLSTSRRLAHPPAQHGRGRGCMPASPSGCREPSLGLDPCVCTRAPLRRLVPLPKTCGQSSWPS